LQLGRFSKLIVNGMAEDKERGFIRETKNYQDDHGASDVSSGRAGGSAATTTLAADGVLPSSLIRALAIPALFKFTWPRHPKESQLISGIVPAKFGSRLSSWATILLQKGSNGQHIVSISTSVK
jgi:hypothetical protein